MSVCVRRGGKRRQRGRERDLEREGREGASGSQEQRAGGGDEEVGARRRARAGGERRPLHPCPERSRRGRRTEASPSGATSAAAAPGNAAAVSPPGLGAGWGPRAGAGGEEGRPWRLLPVPGRRLDPDPRFEPGQSACGLCLTLDQSVCRRDSVSFCDSRGWRPGNLASAGCSPGRSAVVLWARDRAEVPAASVGMVLENPLSQKQPMICPYVWALAFSQGDVCGGKARLSA